MISKNKVVVGIGEVLWDVFPERKVLGGAPANFACHVSRFGFEGHIISAVGRDQDGKEILDNLSANNLSNMIESVDFPTGTVDVIVSEEGIPTYKIIENVAWDNIPFSSQIETVARQCDAVCFGSLAQRNENSRQTIIRFLENVSENAIIIFDVNLRQHYYTKKIILDSLKRANILKLNEDEIVILRKLFKWADIDESSICKRLLEEYKLDLVILTKGINGSCLFTPYESSFCKTPKVQVVDTVGAGDSFTAAIVSGLLLKKDIYTMHQFAVEVAAYVCTQSGGMAEWPSSLLENYL